MVNYAMRSQKNGIKSATSRARRYSLIAVFAALTVGLNLSPIKFPAPYAPFLWYQVWEIPIVATFIFLGFPASVLVALINMIVLLTVFPGALPTGPLYNFAAIVSMLLGTWFGLRLMRRLKCDAKTTAVPVITLLGAAFRVIIMSFVNWTFLRFPPPIGYSLTEEAILLTLPLIALFNATLSLYTVPLGYVIAELIMRRAKFF